MYFYDIPNVKIGQLALLYSLENIKFGKNIIIDDFVVINTVKELTIKDNCHISMFSSITGGETCILGEFTTIAMGCHLLTGSDDYIGSGFGNPTIAEEYRKVKRAPIVLENFVRIGANSVILPGVTIGEGATIGAGSIVTRSLAPWGVYLSNKRIRDRDKHGVLKSYGEFLQEAE